MKYSLLLLLLSFVHSVLCNTCSDYEKSQSIYYCENHFDFSSIIGFLLIFVVMGVMLSMLCCVKGNPGFDVNNLFLNNY